MRGRPDDEALQAIAQNEERRRKQEDRQIGIEPQQPMRKERREQCGGEKGAVREVDDVQDAVDQRKTSATRA